MSFTLPYDIDGYTYGFMLYIAIKAHSTRKDRMKLLAEQMRQTHQKMQQLDYEAHVLTKQGKREKSFKKTKAVRMAKEHWLKLDREYKRLWKADRPIVPIGQTTML